MKVLFKEWSCSNITDKKKEDIQSYIEKELLSFKDDIKPAPENLTVSIFENPHTRLLNCAGVGDNGDELVTCTCYQETGKFALVEGNTFSEI